jgi:small subunit ribosomal protein S16
VAVKIKLKRIGKMREPHYRIVVADARTKRSGRAIEEIGQYHPQEDPSRILLDSERAQYWLGVGAQPTEAVTAILKVTGDWQSFKGEPAPPAMLVAEPKADKREVFAAAAKEAAGLSEKAATTPKKKPAKKAAAKTADADQPADAEKPADADKPAEVAAASGDSAPATESSTEPATDASAAEPATEPAAEPAAESDKA